MKKVEKVLQKLVFGEPAKGEPLKKPKLNTCWIVRKPEENEWYREFKVSSMYTPYK